MIPFFVPKCDHARVIVNRRALYLLQQKGTPSFPFLRMAKRYTDPDVYKQYYSILYSLDWSPSDYSPLKDYYVTLGCQMEYIFSVVKCGKCALCRSSKQAELVSRAQMESALYDMPPYFFTLTYDSKHLPADGELSTRDVQLFFKRLRRNWDKKGVKHNIRYLVAGEYGSKRGRPHYHLLMWNNPYGATQWQPWKDKRLARDVFEAWQNCQMEGFDYGEAGDGAAGYVCKYITKQSVYKLQHKKAYKVEPFIHASNRHGGIGRPLIERDRQYYHSNQVVTTFDFVDGSGTFRQVPIGSYIKSVLHPSVSRQIPARVKTAYRKMSEIGFRLVAAGDIMPWTYRDMMRFYRPKHYPDMYDPVRFASEVARCPLVKHVNELLFTDFQRYKDICDVYRKDPADIDVSGYYGYLAKQPEAVPIKDLAGLEMRARERITDSIERERL